MTDLMVRVITPNYDTWLNAFVSAENGLLDAGINEWTVYQDSWNGNNVMVHFVAEDIDRAMAFFKSDEFKQINIMSGATERRFWVGQEQGGAKPAAKRAAAKPAAAKAPATKAAAKPPADAAKTPAAKPSTKTPKK